MTSHSKFKYIKDKDLSETDTQGYEWKSARELFGNTD